MNIADRYFIKAGYRENLVQGTYDTDAEPRYWTEMRIRNSHFFQYYVYELARDLLLENKFKSVMDVGSGPGTKLKELIAPVCLDIVLVDQPSARGIVEERFCDARFIAVDLSKIDITLNREFDLIICADVIEHLLDPDPCINFIKNHLSEKGLAVLSTPERDNLRGLECNHSPHPAHVREWSGKEFCSYLEHHGWTVHQFYLYPQMRLNAFEQLAWKLLGSNFLRRRWASCQAAVCAPTATESKQS